MNNESFMTINNLQDDILHENNQLCNENNHIYSLWYETSCFKDYNGSTFKNKIWCRKCEKCGNIDFTFVKPKEYNGNSLKKILKKEK